MAAYARSKLILASWPTLRSAVVNVDDAFGLEFQALVKSRNVECVSVGRSHGADCQLLDVAHLENGQRIQLKIDDALTQFETTVIGDFNADNMALVFAVLKQLGHEARNILPALSSVTPPPGRMQPIGDKPAVIVDYAHTPDALEKALQTLRPFAEKRKGKLWVVFGCGGDRDRSKRPLMGAIAAEHADVVLITSDNPRSESPQAIVDEIRSGVDARLEEKVRIEVDRVTAIEIAVCSAEDRDVVLLAGKGHEDTQTVGTQVIPHSDAQCAQSFLARRGAHA